MWSSAVGFLVTLTLCLLGAPLTADAQLPAKVARIGYLALVEDPRLVEAFRQGLRELGYVDGQNIAMESRFVQGKGDRLPALTAELVQLHMDVIVTFPAVADRAAKNTTTTVPIVMVNARDPVGTGLVASLARPGGNITGLSGLATDLSGKRLELLKEAVPSLSRVAVLWNARTMTPDFEQIHAAARALGVTVQPLGVQDASDIESALATMTRERPDALFMITDVLTRMYSNRVVDFGAKSQLPTMFEFRTPVDAGGLMSYGPSVSEQHRRAAYYVARILQGTKPADLPVEQPMTFGLVINLKAAKALGLTIPPALLFQATEVIQ